MSEKSNKVLGVLWDYFLMTVGSVIFCMAWTSFIIPNGLASGGLTGLCTIIQYGTGIPVGLTYPILNVVLLILGFLSLGKGFGFKTIYVIAPTLKDNLLKWSESTARRYIPSATFSLTTRRR